MLEAVHLTSYHGALPAIRDVSFVLQPGRIVGLLGRNGSGKSTTVKIVTGLIQPSSGKVQLDGASIDTDPIAYSYQGRLRPPKKRIFIAHLTGPEYLSSSAGCADCPRVDSTKRSRLS